MLLVAPLVWLQTRVSIDQERKGERAGDSGDVDGANGKIGAENRSRVWSSGATRNREDAANDEHER
jgi:hypothetical protein